MRDAFKGRYLGQIPRRDLLGSGAAVGVLGAALGAAPRPARAQALSGAVPEVDSVAVRVVTDSYHHAFEPTRKMGDLTVQRFAFALAKDRPPRKALQNEWGLALHLESRQGQDTRQILTDFGRNCRSTSAARSASAPARQASAIPRATSARSTGKRSPTPDSRCSTPTGPR